MSTSLAISGIIKLTTEIKFKGLTSNMEESCSSAMRGSFLHILSTLLGQSFHLLLCLLLQMSL